MLTQKQPTDRITNYLRIYNDWWIRIPGMPIERLEAPADMFPVLEPHLAEAMANLQNATDFAVDYSE